MILKIIGGIMIIAACGLIGIAAANKYSQRPKDISRLRTSIQMLETEIVYSCTPLPQALNSISRKLEGPLRDFYNSVSDSLLTGWDSSLLAAWSKCTDVLIKVTALSAADIELLKDFSKVLGSSDRDDQRKHFELFYIRLKQHEELAAEACKKNEKMYKSLGFLSGVVIFVLLV